MNTSKLKVPLTEIQSQILLLEAYDKDYQLDTGYYNVGMCEEEHLQKGSLLEYWAREYKKCRIWEIFHIEFDSFMQRPRSEMQMFCKLALEQDMQDLADNEQYGNLLKQKGIGTNFKY